ncbi:MAG: bifunctional riboflavin kinase/FAD synthetase [Clostridia bacterium]|nr:bifunctional riboflavin kinase/FAD synthetase [Clostridia bacterium]
MRISWEEPRTTGGTIVLGMFDGVHIGHRALFEEAARAGRPLTVCTFARHPMEVLHPECRVGMLMTLMQKLRAFNDNGADETVLMRFDARFAETEPAAFLERLRRDFAPGCVVAGYNYTFGRMGRGDTELLRRYGAEHGFDVKVVPPVISDGEPVSSTRIRELVKSGRVAGAAKLLGHPYELTGTVVKGKGIGRTIGFPTANIQTDPSVLKPGRGVYSGILFADGKAYSALTNIGLQPTVPSGAETVETHIPGYSIDLYGKNVRLILTEKLRDEIRFENTEQLRGQIEKDCQAIRDVYSGHSVT